MSDTDSSISDEESSEEGIVKRPRTIHGKSDFVDINFHPTDSSTLATANMNGYVAMYKCEPELESSIQFKTRVAKAPCRCISFSSTGNEIYVLTKDNNFQTICCSTGQVSSKYLNVHSSSPHCLAVIDQNIVASGDDDGQLKVWDLRKGDTAVMEEKKFEDYISGIAVDNKRRLIFAVSGDGTMATFNARQRKFIIQSENEECDLLCATVMKDNKKLVVGTGNGPLLFYNWNEFAAISDRFPGHPGSVDHMARVTDDILCTASSDGMIRAVHILPNRFLGVVGEHKGMPVEKICCTHDGSFLASCSHDSSVRFWSMDHLKNTNVSSRAKKPRQKKNEKMTKSGVSSGKQDFFNDFNRDLQLPTLDHQSSSEDSGSVSDDCKDFSTNNKR